MNYVQLPSIPHALTHCHHLSLVNYFTLVARCLLYRQMLTGLPSDIAHTKTVITASLGDRMETVSVCLEWVVRGP